MVLLVLYFTLAAIPLDLLETFCLFVEMNVKITEVCGRLVKAGLVLCSVKWPVYWYLILSHSLCVNAK